MKYSIAPTQDFTPLTITLTIESAEELRQLWHRFNIVRSSLTTGYVDTYEGCPSLTDYRMFSGIWDEINRLCDERGIAD
jgi:hypothetical protein